MLRPDSAVASRDLERVLCVVAVSAGNVEAEVRRPDYAEFVLASQPDRRFALRVRSEDDFDLYELHLS